MSMHIDPNDPNSKKAAAEILRRHDIGAPEANITTAVRNFLTVTGLVKHEEIDEENPPAEGSRRAVDLTALDTFIEFKRRIGTTGGFNPDPRNVDQLDDYLAQSEKQGRVRMGILTDGKYWLLRWPNAGPVNTVPPYAFTLEDPDRWITPVRVAARPRPFCGPEKQAAVPAHHRRETSVPTARHTSATSPRSKPSTTNYAGLQHHQGQEAVVAEPAYGRPGRNSRQLPPRWTTCSSATPT